MNSDYNYFFQKSANYCVSDEKCVFDVMQKLYQWGSPESFKEKIIENLIKEGFVDESRYAELFVRSKFNTKKWGKVKIKNALFLKQISNSNINNALKQIDNDEYRKTIHNLILKKQKEGVTEKDKIFRFIANKGFETSLIYEIIEKLY